ncbi:unnamed protein product [Paramecium sonneborni]|uniref:Transmembrane protein n=1 Tax=Paramecium sonneborni TaxID=65129 RepID=A0A8S1M2P9_9CILI|nr:unnamed protein product [Paramecium sonneborni]
MNKQKEQNILRKYIQTNLRMLIVIHQKQQIIYQTLKYVFFIFGQLQSAFFYLYPCYNANLRIYNKFILIYLIRPDLILIDNQMIGLENKYLFLLPLMFWLFFDILIQQGQVFYQMFNRKYSDNQSNQIEISGSFQKMVINLKSIYSQLFIIYFYIPAQVMSFTSFGVSKGIMNIDISIFSIITIILTGINQAINLYISNTCLDLTIRGFERLYFTKFDFFRELFILIQLILYGILNDFENAQIVQAILTLFVSLSYICNVLIDKSIIIEPFSQIILIVHISLISIITTDLLQQWQLGLILIPLGISISCTYRSQMIQDLFQGIRLEKNVLKIIQYISYQINNKQRSFERIDQVSQAILLFQHRQKCNEQICHCNSIENNTDNPINVLFLSQKLQKKFIIQKIKHWNKELNQKKDISSNNSCVFYISALNHYGFTTLAFQECNRLLSLSMHQNRGFLSHSDVNSYSQSHQQSIPSQSSESQKKVNQAKLQELNAKSIEKQQKIKLNVRNNFLDLLTQIKLKIISKDIRLELQNNFLKQQTKQQEEIADAIELYLQSEQQNQIVKHKILKCLQQKFQFYNMILNKKGLRSQQLFDNAKILSNLFYQVEKELLYQYSQFPSQKIQSINCFFQSEILNNYLSAFKLSNFSTIADDKLINMKKNLKINLFGKNVVYMILYLSDNLQTLMISQFSNNTHQFLQQNYEEFTKKNKTIDQILPLALRNEHYMLVQRFMNDGKGKYFRNIDISFLELPNGFLKPFNLIIDIVLNQTEHLSFAAFFEDVSLGNSYILVDVNGVCGGITANLLERSGWKGSEIKQNSKLINASYQIDINLIIPDFNELKLSQKEIKLYNVQINLLNKKLLIGQESRTLLNFHDIWKHLGNLIAYRGTIIISSRELYGYYYYVIEIEDLRQNQTSSHMSNSDGKGMTTQNNDLDNTNEIEISELEVSQPEALINKPQSLNIFQQSLTEIQQDIENNQNFNHSMHLGLSQHLVINRQSFVENLIKLNQTFNEQSFDNNKNIEHNNVVDINPNQSIRKLIDTSKSFGQQKFFNQEIQDLDQSNSKLSEGLQNQMKDVNQLYDVDLNKIDKEMRENIQMQLQLEIDQKNQPNQQIDDAASQVSSLIGLKKSLFYKKYELINGIIDSIFKPTSYKLCHTLFFLQLILIATYCIIILQNLNTDFNRFIQEVDMLLFSYSFMTPFDIFLALRFSTVYYQLQVPSQMTAAENTVFSAWLSNHLGEGYDDMKQNFLEQFSNPQLLEFFTDQDFDVQFMKENSTSMEIKTLSFRETLNVLLQYQYQFKIAYLKKTSLTNQPFSAYPYFNYLNLHDKFDNMTNDILDYTKQRKSIVQENWQTIWIPFLVLDFVLMIATYYYYKQYLSIYESFLNLFKFTDEIWLNRDMERFKILINILTKNSDVMFKYQFDLEQKEKFMMAEKYKKESKVIHDLKKKKNYQNYDKLSSIYGLIGISFVFSIFFIPALLIQLQTNNYLFKYVNTADFYKFTGDLCFQLPGMFSQRQFLYWWSFYNLDVNDKPRMINRLFNGIENLKQFDEHVQQFNQDDYLTTKSFIDKLNLLTKNPVCKFFSGNQYNDYSFYCSRSFDGALDMGLNQALMYAANQYKVTFALNNFTSIVQYFRYEAEGMYIMVKGLIELVTSLKEALLQATYSHMNQIVGLSVFLLVFQFFLFFLQFFILHKYYSEEYNLVKRYMLLLPSSTLLLDDNFERNIRIFYAQYQI